MRIIAAFAYTSAKKAGFFCKEGGFAKHALFQDRQNRYSMIT